MFVNKPRGGGSTKFFINTLWPHNYMRVKFVYLWCHNYIIRNTNYNVHMLLAHLLPYTTNLDNYSLDIYDAKYCNEHGHLGHRHHIKNRLLNDMYRLTWQVNTVSCRCKNTLKSKCYKRAQNKASRPRGQSGLPNVCFCLVPLLAPLICWNDVSQSSMCWAIFFSYISMVWGQTIDI